MLGMPCAPGKPKLGLLVLSGAAVLSAPISQRWGRVRPPKAVPMFFVSAGFGWCPDPSVDTSWGFWAGGTPSDRLLRPSPQTMVTGDNCISFFSSL